MTSGQLACFWFAVAIGSGIVSGLCFWRNHIVSDRDERHRAAHERMFVEDARRAAEHAERVASPKEWPKPVDAPI